MQACVHHGAILRSHALPSSDGSCNRTTGQATGRHVRRRFGLISPPEENHQRTEPSE
ncbi:hypothetical protein SynA15127_01645 [Synechococcus sp. A15-127]|nr:hypothetical protein SynA15127_01645 [Synechococcus sp. A15-127]